MLRERRDKWAHSLAAHVHTLSPTDMAVIGGRYQEIEDLLNTTFQEMMGE